MTVSMFVLWPLTVTSGVGIYKQKKLIDNLIAEMDSYMMPVTNEIFGKQHRTFSEKANAMVDKIGKSKTTQQIVANADKIIRIFTR